MKNYHFNKQILLDVLFQSRLTWRNKFCHIIIFNDGRKSRFGEYLIPETVVIFYYLLKIDANCNAVCMVKHDQLQAWIVMSFMLMAGMNSRNDLIAFLSRKSTSAMRC